MLLLPAAALCCLCSVLVAMAAELIQDDLTLTRRVGEKVSFSCRRTDQCNSDYVHWFQKKDTGTFTKILEIKKTNCQVYSGYNHPQEADFSAVNKKKKEKKENGCELEIQKVKPSHSATYYCCCKGSVGLLFGSGAKLYVTDEQVVKPVVSVYPAASRAHLEGKTSLLCLASAMFPPLVQFSWKRRKENGPLEKLPPAEGEQLELRESGYSAAILLIHQQENSAYKYSCYVQHEGGTVEADTEQEVSTFPPSLPTAASTTPPPPSLPTAASTTPPPPSLPPAIASALSQYQVKLFCVLYTVLIVKSLVYCCGLSLLIVLRNKGPSTNYTW
ncbi:immunoglobulin lambda-1 light chain-like [Epinephelus fuscoguttatus]|uniref:immunoglobulin lambda-1 light chain-like n=1 Tax=Epinephelus fuscoguttatus TaxID=293821 RepID=UPI0020D03F8A|nr:immunoglobulin lambda-1 light chain-like [Epinephelus fuscoguttatus]